MILKSFYRVNICLRGFPRVILEEKVLSEEVLIGFYPNLQVAIKNVKRKILREERTLRQNACAIRKYQQPDDTGAGGDKWSSVFHRQRHRHHGHFR